MAKITAARGRVGFVVAAALIGMVACQDAVQAGGHGQDALDVLSKHVVAANIGVAGPSPAVVASAPAAAAGSAAVALPRSEDGASVLTAQELARSQPPATTPPATTPPRPPLVVPTSPSEWFNPRGQHEGTEGIVSDLAQLGVTDNSPLYVNECWGRTWGSTTSDHHASQLRSWACDLSIAGVQVPTPQAQEAARRIGSALGVQGWSGGNLVKVIDGYRIQVLWMVADHYNHVHVGARKL